MNRFLDIIIPRFITEKVAAIWIDGALQPICAVQDLTPDDMFDVIVEVRSFNLFGFGLFPKLLIPEISQ